MWQLFGGLLKGMWNTLTGQRQIEQQNKANMELAKYQTHVQEEMYKKYSSPEALMRQYQNAGLNPNLVYGSASAGQGNVPSFSAPTIERSLSGSQKLDKALSTISSAAGLVQNVYQASAAKEAAEQSGIKTLRDIVLLAKDEGDLRLQNSLFGGPVYDSFYVRKFRGDLPHIGVSSGGYLENYSKQWRDYQINQFIRSGLSNLADFGVYAGQGNGSLKMSNYFGTPYNFTRNYQNSLKYQLSKELGNKGVYGKLAVSLINGLL